MFYPSEAWTEKEIYIEDAVKACLEERSGWMTYLSYLESRTLSPMEGPHIGYHSFVN